MMKSGHDLLGSGHEFSVTEFVSIKARVVYEERVMIFGGFKTHLEPRIADFVVACHPTHSNPKFS